MPFEAVEPFNALLYSRIAYTSEQYQCEYFDACGGRLLAPIASMATGTDGYIADLPWGIVIGFRGTELLCKKDIKTDLNRRPMYHQASGGMVHTGFNVAFASVRSQIEDALLPKVDAGIPIHIYGHSLGGAIAVLAAYHLQESHGLTVAHVGVLGCPKVGDGRWSAQYNKALHAVTHSYVNCCDVVPRVPFWNYSVGQLHYIDSDKTLHRPTLTVNGDLTESTTGTFRFFDRLKGRFENWGRIPSRGIRDHLLNSYGEGMR